MHQKHPFLTRKGDDGFSRGSAGTRKGDDGFSRGSAGARKGDRGFRQADGLADRAWLRYPWAAYVTNVVKPTRFKSPREDPVTNVVNLSRKISVFNEKAVELTTFVTTTQESTRKTPRIDDVCNNTQRNAPKSQHDKPDHIGGPEKLRCPRAATTPPHPKFRT